MTEHKREWAEVDGYRLGHKSKHQKYPCVTYCNTERAVYAYSVKKAVLIDLEGNVLDSGTPYDLAVKNMGHRIQGGKMSMPCRLDPEWDLWITSGVKPKGD